VNRADIRRAARLVKAFREIMEHLRDGADGNGDVSFRALEPNVRLSDVVLSPKTRNQVEAAILASENLGWIRRALGRMGPSDNRNGLVLLFTGPPGTGKTYTAEAIAGALGKKLCVVDYSMLESCWVGETEKNIARLFKDVAASGGVLFLDEADAVLRARNPDEPSWATREVNVLLKTIEEFSGILIMATNLNPVLDKALARRVDMVVEFDNPDERLRRRIWEVRLPAKKYLSGDVDINGLAARYPLAGGEIFNAVKNAVITALASGKPAKVKQKQLEDAASAELAKRKTLQKDWTGVTGSYTGDGHPVGGYA
jgi:SpoVK/Ycf46/Vps4 family AAA+-type ATPase